MFQKSRLLVDGFSLLLKEVKMAVQNPRRGYRDNQSPEETEVECPVCLNVLCDPKLAACCGHSVCAACIDQIESGKKSCPLCTQKTQLVDDKHLKQPLGRIGIHIVHAKNRAVSVLEGSGRQ